MFDSDTLRQLGAQPVEELVQALERLHRARRDLPSELRQPAAAAAVAVAAAPLAAAPVPPPAPLAVPAPIDPVPAPVDPIGSPLARLNAGTVLPRPEVSTVSADLASGLRSVLGEYEGLLRRYNEDFDRLFQQSSTPAPALVATELRYGGVAGASPGDPAGTAAIVERLKQAQLLFLKFPIAAQAAFAAFVEEGRQYAQTAEGMRWKQALVRSPLLEEVSGILSSLSLGALRERPHTVIPSAIADLLVSAASHPQLRSILERAFAAKEPG